MASAEAAEAGAARKMAVFVSGGGSNLRAIYGRSPNLAAVVTDKPTCGGAEFARERGVPVVVYPPTEKANAAGEGAAAPADPDALVAVLKENGADVVLLAGYLKLVPEELVRAYHRRMLNIHPALLPGPFGGKGMYGANVHRAVVESGVKLTGCTVHFVDEEYDRGAILGQRCVPVRRGDTPDDVARRVLEQEHVLFPECAQALCEDRVAWDDAGVPWIVD